MGDTPRTNGLWCKLMDMCKRFGRSPADFDSLFAELKHFRTVEQDNARLRTELAEAKNDAERCRSLLNEAANKLGREHEGLVGEICEAIAAAEKAAERENTHRGAKAVNAEEIAVLREAAELIDEEAEIYLASNLADDGDWIDEEDEQHYERIVAISDRLREIADRAALAAAEKADPPQEGKE